MEQTIDYWKLFAQLMERRASLIRQRDAAEVELSKLKQTIASVFVMLTEEQQKANQQVIDDMDAESAGLQDAIKLVFSTHEGELLTASAVRDCLNEIGFDFRQYKANPLASISTTLKRVADTGFIETTPTASGAMYRRNPPFQRPLLLDLIRNSLDATKNVQGLDKAGEKAKQVVRNKK